MFIYIDLWHERRYREDIRTKIYDLINILYVLSIFIALSTLKISIKVSVVSCVSNEDEDFLVSY